MDLRTVIGVFPIVGSTVHSDLVHHVVMAATNNQRKPLQLCMGWTAPASSIDVFRLVTCFWCIALRHRGWGE